MSFIDYIRDTKAEMRHVKWPSKRQTVAYSVIVVLASVATAVYLGFFDFVFSKLIRLLIS